MKMDTIMYQVIKTGDGHTITYKGNGGTIPITTPKANRCPKNNIADFTVYKDHDIHVGRIVLQSTTLSAKA